jgi:CheY-like chemotaxis protein
MLDKVRIAGSLRIKGKSGLKPCVILLVEDDANDAFFVTRALKDLGFSGTLEHVTDTFKAREYLTGEGAFSDREKYPLPEIVISDASLPGRGSGIELLEWMRRDPALADAPFIMLSGEITTDVRERAHAAGVRLLLRKGSNFRDTAAALREALLQMPDRCRSWLKPS